MYTTPGVTIMTAGQRSLYGEAERDAADPSADPYGEYPLEYSGDRICLIPRIQVNISPDHEFLAIWRIGKIQEAGTEWFRRMGNDCNNTSTRRLQTGNRCERISRPALRAEQREAVRMTKAYFEQGGTEFLWNAAPSSAQDAQCLISCGRWASRRC